MFGRVVLTQAGVSPKQQVWEGDAWPLSVAAPTLTPPKPIWLRGLSLQSPSLELGAPWLHGVLAQEGPVPVRKAVSGDV